MTATSFGQIIAGPKNTASSTAFTVLSDGRIVVVSNDNTGAFISARFYDASGTTLGAPITLTTATDPDLTPHLTGPGLQVAALTGGGFAVLAGTSTGTSIDYVATFDAAGNRRTAFTPVESGSLPAPVAGQHTLIALSGGGYFVGWNTTVAANTLFNPLLAGAPSGTIGNATAEGSDAYGASFNAAGTLTASYTFDAGTGLATGGYAYNGLAGDQNLRGPPVQLPNGTIVQPYTDQSFGIVYAGGYGLVQAVTVSISLNGGPRTVVYAPSFDSRGNTIGELVDVYANIQVVALSDGRFAVFYETNPSSRVGNTNIAFYNADGSRSGAAAQVLSRSGLDGSPGSYPNSPISVVAMPTGGFAIAYLIPPLNGSNTTLQVSLYDGAGNQQQTVPIPVTYTGGGAEPPSLSVAANGSLYVQDGLSQAIYAVLGAAPGDFALNASADTAAETLTGTSATHNFISAGSGTTTIVGGSGTNVLHGGPGLDLITGGPGNDTIYAGSGSGSIDGGGGSDTVVLADPQSAYAVTQSGAALTITNLATGAAQTLTNIQAVRFADQPLALPLQGLPNLSSILSPLAIATLGGALAVLNPSGTPAGVPTVPGGSPTVAPVPGGLNALVVNPATTGTSTTLPAGFLAGYMLGAGGTLTDNTGGALLVGGASTQTLIGAAGDTLIGDQNSATTFLPGAGGSTIVGGNGANLIELGASTALVTSQGSDTIIGSSTSATVNASGASLLFGATGATLFNALGATATLVGGGAETVAAGAANVLLFGGAGPVTFNAGTGISTVVSGMGGATVNGGTAPVLYFGTGPTTYNPGSAIDTIIGFTGTLTATGGANGTLFFTGTGGANNVSTGNGSTTIIGFGADDTLTATGSGSDVIAASGAAETVNGGGSSGTNTFFAFGANDVLIGGAGQTALESGLGNHTLIGGSGSTLFEILAGTLNRAITIGNFNAAQDFVQLQGYDAAAASPALQHASYSNGSEVLTLNDGTTLTFQGVTGLTASSFV